MLQRYLPFAEIAKGNPHNPLFKVEIRRVAGMQNPQQMLSYSRWVFGIILAGTLALWLLSIYGAWDRLSVRNYYDYRVYNASNQVLLWVFVISLLSNFLLDMRCMIAGLGSISTEIISGRWDLLRLTLLRMEYMVEAKHAVAQVRSWRWMVIIVSLRATSIILVLLQAFVLPLILGAGFSSYAFSSLFTPFNLYIFVGIGILAAVWIVEPYLRMRALTALSLALSARIHNLTYAFLAAFVAIVLVWISQIIIIAVFLFASISMSLVALYCSPFIFLCFAIFVWVYYRSLKNSSLRRATDRLLILN